MMDYSIGGFAKIAGLTAPTLRYYEKEKLIIPHRDNAGRRYYTNADISWIEFIKRLKETGMPIKEIQKYAVLRAEGDGTMSERLSLLEKHLTYVEAEKAKWEANLLKLKEKIGYYEEKIAGAPVKAASA